MLQQEQLIGNPIGLAIVDEALLQVECVRVADEAESTYFERSQSHPSSNASSRSFTNARNLPASAPSMRR